MQPNRFKSRKLILFVAMVLLLTVGFVYVNTTNPQAVTSEVVIMFGGLLVILYLFYVFGNVASKITFGKFEAQLRQNGNGQPPSA